MKKILWEVRFTRAPSVLRYCKHCGAKTEFVSSGLFRVNAQQKDLDVWLIYKCAVCDTTWKLTLLSRVSPRELPPEILRGFYSNDGHLAMRYATDIPLIRRGGAEVCLPDFEVIGETVSLSESAEIRLVPQWPSELRATAVLREKLGLSRSAFDAMHENGVIRCTSGHDLKKCKLNGEIIVTLHP